MIISYFYYYLFLPILNMRRKFFCKMHFISGKMQHIIFIL
jgi:hypothetical protein